MRTRSRLPRRAAALAAVAVIALAGCSSGSGGKNTGGSGQGFVSAENDRIARVAPQDRKAAPDISGETLDGERIKLADFRGKVVVLNVWGSWCAPCRAEAKNLQQVWTDTQAQGVQFLGINTRDSTKDNARAFEREKGVTYPSLWDPDARQILRFRGDLNPNAIPTTLVVDREGRIAARFMGPLTTEQLRSMIDPVIAEKAA